MMADIVRPLALAGSLLGRFWPQLLLIGALGYIARDLLLNAAVAVGLQNALGGMVVLSLVVLTKLMVVVLMFGALRPGMPALASLRQEATVAGGGDRPATGDHMLAVTAAAILPFFAYYAAWGFLGDTVREYSRLALQRVPFGERLNIFNFVQSQGMVASIAACWAIRWFAKRMNARARSPYWRLLIVAADATWIFIGLYALGVWKNDLITWIGAGAILQSLNEHLPALSMAAHAADGFTPVEFRAAPLFEQLQRLFFYALLPLVWLVMAAIINGYELSAATAPLPAGTSRADTWRKWFKDFVKHFVGGYRSRYQPILTCLRLTLSTGLATPAHLRHRLSRARLDRRLAVVRGHAHHRRRRSRDMAGHRQRADRVHRQPERSRRRHPARCRPHRPVGGGPGTCRREPADAAPGGGDYLNTR